MLKKFKILMLIIILSLAGIISVISIWLYGSYKFHIESSVTEVERSLFSTVQNYYNAQQGNDKQYQKWSYHNFSSADLVEELRKVYRNIDSVKTQQLIDSVLTERFSYYNAKKENGHYNNSNRSLVPPFGMGDLALDTNTLVIVDSMLTQALHDKGIYFDVDIVLERIEDKHKRYRPKVFVDSLGFVNTRPVMVNPQNNEFVKVRFQPPISHVLSKMIGQLVVAFLLIFGLIGTFIYLFWTINRQNKLALLRKSFVNNMTHELKTPVATVMAAIEAVQRYGAKDDKVKMEKYLHISQQELSHLANMIEKVLQLDMDEVKGIELNKTTVDVKLLLNEAIELGELCANKPVDINLFAADDSFLILADAAHLKNVFNNLLDNAIKYSTRTAQVDVTIRKLENQAIAIEIKDRGIGIAQNYLYNIFEMFFRVPSGDLHPVKGFGLGLAYVKQVVEQHGGTVSVSSEVDRGTIFVIKLPL